jgi:hypothetical protein
MDNHAAKLCCCHGSDVGGGAWPSLRMIPKSGYRFPGTITRSEMSS